MFTIFRSLVRSRLEYSCPVWNPSLLGEIKKLKSIQRVFTRHISGCQDLCYWDRLKRLCLMCHFKDGESAISSSMYGKPSMNWLQMTSVLYSMSTFGSEPVVASLLCKGLHQPLPNLSTINPLRSWDLNSGTSSLRVSHQLHLSNPSNPD